MTKRDDYVWSRHDNLKLQVILPWESGHCGDYVRAARVTAGLTQDALAAKLGRSRVLVSRVESSHVRVGERYVLAVLGACGLPRTWRPEPRGTRRA